MMRMKSSLIEGDESYLGFLLQYGKVADIEEVSCLVMFEVFSGKEVV